MAIHIHSSDTLIDHAQEGLNHVLHAKKNVLDKAVSTDPSVRAYPLHLLNADEREERINSYAEQVASNIMRDLAYIEAGNFTSIEDWKKRYEDRTFLHPIKGKINLINLLDKEVVEQFDPETLISGIKETIKERASGLLNNTGEQFGHDKKELLDTLNEIKKQDELIIEKLEEIGTHFILLDPENAAGMAPGYQTKPISENKDDIKNTIFVSKEMLENPAALLRTISRYMDENELSRKPDLFRG